MNIEEIRSALCQHYAARRLDELTQDELEEQVRELLPFLSLIDERGRARLLHDLGEGVIDGAELKVRCEANAPDGRKPIPSWMK